MKKISKDHIIYSMVKKLEIKEPDGMLGAIVVVNKANRHGNPSTDSLDLVSRHYGGGSLFFEIGMRQYCNRRNKLEKFEKIPGYRIFAINGKDKSGKHVDDDYGMPATKEEITLITTMN